MILKIKNIEWCVEEEDVIDLIDDYEDMSQSEVEAEVEKLIIEVLDTLPTECEVEIDEVDYEELSENEDDLEEYICNELSDEFDWLVYSFDYEVVKEEN